MAAFLVAVSTGPASAQGRLSGEALIEALRAGGYIIYFRHAATDWSADDHIEAEGDWTSCDPERIRQLSEQGRETARRIGAAIRRLDIPVGRVLSSEYCRARQTAENMSIGPVETTREIMNMRAAEYLGGRDAVVERARRALGRRPDPDTNTVIVGHGNLMLAASGVYGGEAHCAVFSAVGDGAFKLVAELSPEDWERLAGRFGQPG